MAAQYAFSAEQQQQLTELLASENNSLWSAVLYGISVGDGEIVSVALSQVGNVVGQPDHVGIVEKCHKLLSLQKHIY